MQLLDCLKKGLRTENQVKTAQEYYKEFKDLMKKADKAYMGGEDVFESLTELEKEAAAKLSKRKARVNAVK